MSNFDYPKVKQSLGRAALHDPYPAYFLDSCGVIYAANLMAFWLWDILRPGEPVRPDALLGTCVFNILADNFERIPADQNAGFYAKRSAFVKRMDANLNSPLYTSFISAMKANPALARIYVQAVPQIEHEWDYSLSITSPGEKDSSSLLKFQVTIYCIEGDSGFLVMYSPTAATLPVVEEQYSLLMGTYSDNEYVLLREQDNEDSNLFLTNLTNSSRPYYPTLAQDSLWYITAENRAHHLLVGAPVVGIHFFELFFAPQLHKWMGPIQETSAPRAIRYFDMFTASFLREDHELHAGYERLMKRLLQLPEFPKLLDISRKLNIHINMSNNPEVPFYTCRVILPWALSYEIALQFRSMVRFMYKSPFIATDRRYYQVTLIPENDETEVALILLHLAPTGTGPATDDTGNASLKQFLWGLAALKTVKEGLAKKDEGNMQWEPETAFERIHTELIAGSAAPLEEMDDVLAELRIIIEALNRKGMVDQEILLTMLKSCATSIHLDRLSDFCTRELEFYKKVKV